MRYETRRRPANPGRRQTHILPDRGCSSKRGELRLRMSVPGHSMRESHSAKNKMDTAATQRNNKRAIGEQCCNVAVITITTIINDGVRNNTRRNEPSTVFAVNACRVRNQVHSVRRYTSSDGLRNCYRVELPESVCRSRRALHGACPELFA